MGLWEGASREVLFCVIPQGEKKKKLNHKAELILRIFLVYVILAVVVGSNCRFAKMLRMPSQIGNLEVVLASSNSSEADKASADKVCPGILARWQAAEPSAGVSGASAFSRLFGR